MSTVATPAPSRRVPVEVIRDRNPSAAVLARAGCTSQDELANAVAAQFQLPRLALDTVDLAPALADALARATAEKHRIVPVFAAPQELTIATSDPTQLEVFDWLSRQLKSSVAVVIATPAEIGRAIRRLYDERVSLNEDEPEAEVSKEALAEASTIVREIITAALRQQASDIHIEATDRGTLVRFRVDGVLRTIETRPPELHAAIVSRIKVLAKLDISLHHVPQDGRTKLASGSRSIDLRVSVLPTFWGEKVVCRLLDNQRVGLSLPALGFDGAQYASFKKMIDSPHGLVLVTGPTGSGKSTTLYAALNEVLSPEMNVVTVEDPIEYQLPGINQVPVNAKRGLTFASALRSILRQDPDVILVGEIRDHETGVIAAEAALTGHLVMTSLHTNDAVGAITRLTEIGIPPYLVAPSLLGVVAQRLVRRICTECLEQYEPTGDELEALELPALPADTRVARGRGCTACQGSGYSGRVAVREVLHVTERMRGEIARGATADRLTELAREAGFRSMRFAALRAWLAGITTSREVMRLTCS